MQYQHNAELESARTEVAVANRQADLALEIMQKAISYADSATAIADSAVKRAEATAARRVAQAPAVAKIVAAAPDTCAPVIAALEGARDLAVETADAWKQAYDSTAAAAARLKAAGEVVVPAVQAQTEVSEHLADASRPGFFARLVPKVGVNATIGVDPLKPEEGVKKVVGVGVSWSF